MDATCTIQDSIHVFSLVHKYVSRILGTYHVAGVFFTQSTYFYQVYDDNRWWISWYQTLGKGGTTS